MRCLACEKKKYMAIFFFTDNNTRFKTVRSLVKSKESELLDVTLFKNYREFFIYTSQQNRNSSN